ncbi:hypothetical protein AB1Y20_011435 [Prymnesium parvum]|uniref:C-type lectin domain-containing protein n=1 Tax=Prymnesium parvum TaxID=97485 RepID=A0AB34IPJ6_PRYPA
MRGIHGALARVLLLLAPSRLLALGSGCLVDLRGQGGLSRTLEADAALFGPHATFSAEAEDAGLLLLPESCLRGCVHTSSGAECAPILSEAAGRWAVVRRAAGGACAEGPPPAGALSAAAAVRAAQSVGSAGVLLVEADDAAAEGALAAADGGGIVIPSLWTRRGDWGGAWELTPDAVRGWLARPRCTAAELPTDGSALEYSAAARRTLYFRYQPPSALDGIALVATPKFGAPRLSVESMELPHAMSRSNVAASLEDGEPAVRMASMGAGVYLLALHAVSAASRGTVRVQRHWAEPASGAAQRLLDGEPYRLHVAPRGWAQLWIDTPPPAHAVEIRAAVLAGQGVLYACREQVTMPSISDLAARRPPSGCVEHTSLGAASDGSLVISQLDPPWAGCTSASCHGFLSVFSLSGAEVSLTTSTRSAPPRLVEGVAQPGATTSHGPSSFSLWSSDEVGFSVAMTPLLSSCGDASQTTSLTLRPRSYEGGDHIVRALSSSAVISLPHSHADRPSCALLGCEYTLDVESSAPCRFALLLAASAPEAAPSPLPLLLQDGIPTTAHSNVNGSRVFAVVVPNKRMDLVVTLTLLAGEADLFASSKVGRPSAAAHEKASRQPGELVDQLVLSSESPEMTRSLLGPAVKNVSCTWYVAVEATGGVAAYYSIVSSQRWSTGPLVLTLPAAAEEKGVLSAEVPLGAPLRLSEPIGTAAAPTQMPAKLTGASLSPACGGVSGSYLGFIAVAQLSDECSLEAQWISIQSAHAAAALLVGRPGEDVLATRSSGQFTRYGTNWSGAHIPLVVVPFATWTASLSAPMQDAALRLSLRAPPVRVPRLLLGVPQGGAAARGEMTRHIVSVPPEQSLQLLLSVEYGECELYASDGSRFGAAEPSHLPTLSDYTAREAAHGELRLHSRARDVRVGVYGWRDCAYSIVARPLSDASQAVQLQDGVPMLGHADRRPSYFRFQPQPGRDVQVSVTPLSGADPNLAIDQSAALPSVFVATWSSALSGLEIDHVVIDAHDPKLRPAEPLDIAVFSNGSATFSIAAASTPHGLPFAYTLLAGVPLRVHLESSAYAHFRFTIDATNASSGVVIRAAPEFGDPDLYVNVAAPSVEYWPSTDAAEWEESEAGADTMRIPADACEAVVSACASGGSCGRCTYYVSVYGWSETTLTLTASLEEDPVLLQEGVPFRATAAEHTYTYYDFALPTLDAAIEVTVTAIAGDPDAYGSFELPRPTNLNFDPGMMSASSEGVDTFLISPTAATYPTDLPAWLHVAVHAFTATTYTIMVRRVGSEEGGGVTLLPGQPQTGNLEAGQRRFYRFQASDDATVSYSFVVVPMGTGDPDLYVSTSGLPDLNCGDECWKSTSSSFDEVMVSPQDARYCSGCTYHVMVHAADDLPVDYSISATVRTQGAIITLQEGVPLHDGVPVHQYHFYAFDVVQADASVRVTLTPFSGDVDLYGSFVRPRPTKEFHNFSSINSGPATDQLLIYPDDPHFCPSVPCQLYVSAYGYSGENSTFSLVALTTLPAHLVDGRPQQGSLEANSWDYYSFRVGGAVESFEVVVSPSFGDPDIYVSAGGRSRPTRNSYSWRANDNGGDSLEVSAPSADPGAWCGNCTYTIGVYGWSACSYTITATSRARGRSASVLLQEGVPVSSRVRYQEIQYYQFIIADANRGVTISATPEGFGDVDVFVSFTTTHPTAHNFSHSARNYGPESLHIAHTDEHYCVTDPCTVFIGVSGEASWEQTTPFTIEVHQVDETAVFLADGRPLRVSAAKDEWRYFRFAIGEGALPSNELLHPDAECKSRDVDLGRQRNLAACTSACAAAPDCTFFIFGKGAKAGDCFFELTADGTCGEGWESDEFDFYALRPSYLLRHEGAECLSGDSFLGNFATVGECATSAFAAGTTFFIYGFDDRAGRCYAETTATADCPEGWQPKPYSFYEVSRGPLGTTEFTVSVTPSMGDPDIYVTNDGLLPDAQHFGWHAVAAGEDAVTMDAHDPGWCSGCEYLIGVTAAQRPANFSVVAATHGAVVVLEDGVPHLRSLQAGEAHYYRVYIPSGDRTDVQVAVTPLSGEPDLYASTTVHRPNASIGMHSYSAATVGRDTISIDHTDEELMRCVHHSPHCVLYVAVYGRAAGTYTVVASLDVVDSGLTVNSPASLAGNYVFSPATFGPPLPVIGTPRPLAVASPWEACTEVTPNLSGKIALIGRGTCFFIEKTFRAQAAGAVAVIIVNSGEGTVGMMPPPGSDLPSQITIPTVMISHQDGVDITATLSAGHTVMATLHNPRTKPVQLVDGIPQDAVGTLNEFVYFTFRAPSLADGAPAEVTFSLTPHSGEADIYITADGTPPSQTHYGWASAQAGHDAVIISPSDAGVLPRSTYIVGVLADPLARFTILASSPAAIVSLPIGVSIFERVKANHSQFFKAFVNEANTSLTFALTSFSGAPAMFTSHDFEHPSSEHGDLVANFSSNAKVITVTADQIARRCLGVWPCVYFVGVYASGRSAASFRMLATNRAIASQLQIGSPQTGELRAGSPHFFVLQPSADVSSVTLELSTAAGTAEDIVMCVEMGPLATLLLASTLQLSGCDSLHYSTAGREDNHLIVSAGDEGWCTQPPCGLLIGVFSLEDTTFTLLAQGTPAASGCRGVVSGLSCFEYYASPLSWSNAEEACVARGGHLASIRSEEENTHVKQLCLEPCWIGYTDRAVEGRYVWTDGALQGYSNWNAGEPNGQAYEDTDAAYMYISTNDWVRAGKWDDTSLSEEKPYVCRKEEDGGGAAQMRNYISLQDGVPTRLRVPPQEVRYLSFLVESAHRVISLTVTTVSGTPVVGASFDSTMLDLRTEDGRVALNATFEAVASTGRQHLRIFPNSSEFCDSLPCVLYVAVASDALATECSVLATQTELLSVALEVGIPQAGAVSLHDSVVYTLNVGDNQRVPIMITLTPLDSSDPDMYISAREIPSREASHWQAMSFAADTIVLMPDDEHYCTGCTYFILVYGFSETQYTISARLLGSYGTINTLQEGLPARGVVPAGTYLFYQIPIERLNVSISAYLTPLSGDADLYASFVQHRPTKGNSNFSSTSSGTTNDQLRISPSDPHFCHSQPCRLFISVYGYRNSSFSLVVSQREVSRVRLIDGQPQVGSLESHTWEYYTFSVTQRLKAFQLSVNPEFGDPDVYVNAGNVLPTRDNSQWQSTSSGADEFTIDNSTNDAWCVDCSYTIGVYAWSATDYTLTVIGVPIDPTDQQGVTLQDAVPVQGQVQQNEYTRYSFPIASTMNGVRLILFCSAGDADLYASFTVANPTREQYSYASENGVADEIHITHTDPRFCPQGPLACVLHVNVYGYFSSSYTLMATQYDEAPVQLSDGRPFRVSAAKDEWRYFRFAIGEGALPSNELLHPDAECKSRDVDLGRQRNLAACTSACAAAPDCTFFIFGKGAKAGDCFFELTLDGTCGEGWESDEFDFYALRPSYLLRHEGAECLSGDSFLGNFATVGECATSAFAAGTTFFIYGFDDRAGRCYAETTATADCPEGWQPKPYSFYEVSRGPLGTTEFTVSVTPSMGDPDIYVTNDGLLPDAQHFGWHAVAAGEDAVTMDAHDPGWCSGCEYLIGVTAAQRPANFSVVAATHGAVVVLEDGVPHLRSLQAGEAHYYRVYIPSGDRTDVQVAVTPLSGEPDLYASTTVHRPNASIGMHSYSAATVGRDTISIEHTDEELMRCVHHSPHCVLYVAVYGRAAGTYTVVASLDVVDSGLTVNSPASLAGNYVFSSAAFGPPLPVIGTPRPLAVASPWEACTEVTPNLSGKIALIGRGTCDFIEKTLHAQAAGAVAVVIVNTDSDGVINMAGTSEETISIPTVMVSHEDGQSWKIVLSNDQAVMLTLYSSVNRPTELRNGVPQDHFLQPSEIKYFSFSVSGASRVNIALTSSITPFDADLYVSTDGTLPSSTHYGFKSTSGSSDALTLRLGDSGFVSDGVYILGIVNAGSGGGVFELVASTDFFPVYLREGYPMYDQVDFETPAYFRFSKTEPDTAVRVLVTKLSGDPDICIVRNQTRLLQLPSLLGRWWERGSSEQAAAFFSGVSLACEWSSTLQGSDVLTIPHTDPHGGLGDYYVAILGTNVGTNSFHIVVQTADDSEVVLVGGRPQQGTLQPGAWNYYRLDVGPDTANVTALFNPAHGITTVLMLDPTQQMSRLQ